MTNLTADYLKAHRHSLHTPESWGRALAEQILQAAIPKTKAGLDTIDIDAKFTVEAYEPLGCVQVCGTINGVQVCYHINT